MSGFCGFFNLDGAPATGTDLAAMMSQLGRRRAEISDAWRNGPAGLGYAQPNPAPTAAAHDSFYFHPESGCAIAADVRIDNRDELISALAADAKPVNAGDATLVLLAYLKWGEDCVNHLLGDFAFAVYDSRRQAMFCARDGFGMRPFYYHHAPGRRFVFASNPRTLHALPQVPFRLNDGRIADFLVPELQWIDYTSTFFEDVFRLPPGCCATVSSSGVNIREHWRPTPGPELGKLSDEEYAAGFLDVFEISVDARLRVQSGSCGSMLSGGMDSGSIVAVAKDLLDANGHGPLRTYSTAQRPDVDCAESRAIHAAATMSAIAPTVIYPDDLDDLQKTLSSGYDEPFDASFTMLKAIYLTARAHGHRVLLDGGAGDIVLNDGSYITRLIQQGQFSKALHIIRGEAQFWNGTSYRRNLARYFRTALVPVAVRQWLQPYRRRAYVRRSINESLISAEFANHVSIPQRFARYWELQTRISSRDPAVERCDKILPNALAGRERYARLAASAGIVACDPFLDRRVVKYCAQLPGRMLIRDGWPKTILRDLMQDRLPDEVRNCRGKPHIGWVFNKMVTQRACDQGQLDPAELRNILAGYVDPNALEEAWRTFHAGEDFEPLHMAYALSTWLRENVSRVVVSS